MKKLILLAMVLMIATPVIPTDLSNPTPYYSYNTIHCITDTTIGTDPEEINLVKDDGSTAVNMTTYKHIYMY